MNTSGDENRLYLSVPVVQINHFAVFDLRCPINPIIP